MENSKRFSPAFTSTAVQSAPLLHQCRALFPQADAVNLAAIDLNALNMEAAAACGAHDLASRFLLATEHERFRSFTSPKRQIEWLGGRIAAKTAVRNLLTNTEKPQWHDLEIITATSGRPLLHNHALEKHGIDLSISHSGSLAASFCCMNGTCGLDIQKITPSVERIKERFAHEDEIALLRHSKTLASLPSETLLTLLWSAKEAFRKAVHCTPLVGFLEVRLNGITEDSRLGIGGQFQCCREEISSDLTAHLSLHNEYACAVTVLPAKA